MSEGDRPQDGGEPGEDLGPDEDLTGKLLVATSASRRPELLSDRDPGLGACSCRALGLVLNHPMGVPVGEILEPWHTEANKCHLRSCSQAARCHQERSSALCVPREKVAKRRHCTSGMASGAREDRHSRPFVVPDDHPPLDGVRLFSGYSGWSADQLDERDHRGCLVLP